MFISLLSLILHVFFIKKMNILKSSKNIFFCTVDALRFEFAAMRFEHLNILIVYGHPIWFFLAMYLGVKCVRPHVSVTTTSTRQS